MKQNSRSNFHRAGAIGLICLIGGAGPAIASTPGDSLATPLTNLDNPYATTVSPAPSLLPPTGTGAAATSSTLASAAANLGKNIHGYVSAGVSTHGGENLSAGMMVPLVPGKADLAVSGTQGQIGDLPHPVGTKAGTANYRGYQATLLLHPIEGLDAAISFSQENWRASGWK